MLKRALESSSFDRTAHSADRADVYRGGSLIMVWWASHSVSTLLPSHPTHYYGFQLNHRPLQRCGSIAEIGFAHGQHQPITFDSADLTAAMSADRDVTRFVVHSTRQSTLLIVLSLDSLPIHLQTIDKSAPRSCCEFFEWPPIKGKNFFQFANSHHGSCRIIIPSFCHCFSCFTRDP